MNRRVIVMVALLGLGACATSVQDLGHTKTFTTAENYQLVHYRLAQSAGCAGGTNIGMAQLVGEQQLYPDLGFGEASIKMSGAVGTRDFQWFARTSKQDSGGALVEIRAKSPAGVREMEQIARGMKTVNCRR